MGTAIAKQAVTNDFSQKYPRIMPANAYRGRSARRMTRHSTLLTIIFAPSA
jgi:hypothetical protein